jgi:hypothetical protein
MSFSDVHSQEDDLQEALDGKTDPTVLRYARVGYLQSGECPCSTEHDRRNPRPVGWDLGRIQ